MGKRVRLVAVNARGHRVGQDHPRARLSDHEVDLIRELAEERGANGKRVWGFRKLAKKFDVSQWTIAAIIYGRCRCESVAGFRRVEVDE